MGTFFKFQDGKIVYHSAVININWPEYKLLISRLPEGYLLCLTGGVFSPGIFFSQTSIISMLLGAFSSLVAHWYGKTSEKEMIFPPLIYLGISCFIQAEFTSQGGMNTPVKHSPERNCSITGKNAYFSGHINKLGKVWLSSLSCDLVRKDIEAV